MPHLSLFISGLRRVPGKAKPHSLSCGRSVLLSKILFLAGILTIAPLLPNTAMAQEAVPGGGCSVAGAYTRSGGPEISGGHMLLCDGANWVSIMSYDASGYPSVGPSVTGLSVPLGFGATSSVNSLDDLTDVSLSAPSSGECLYYNGTSWTDSSCGFEPWVAGAGSDIYYNAGTPQVGIGTTTPAATLDVVGDIYFTGLLVDLSDIRMKENVAPLPNPLTQLTSLQGLSYQMKNDPKHRTEFGFSAQEVKKVYPNLVYTADDKDGTMAVNYLGLIAPMVEAMKIQQKQIEDQQKQIDSLRAELDTMRKTRAQ